MAKTRKKGNGKVKKDKSSIILKRGQIPEGFFRITEKLDEEVILAELTDTVAPSELVYHYKNDKGAEVWGLSIAGVREAKRVLTETQGIVFETSEPKYTMQEDSVIVQVEVKMFEVSLQKLPDGTTQVIRVPRGNNWGMVSQPRRMKVKKRDVKGNLIKENGVPVYEEIDDPFYLQKAYSKALRNAILGMIPIQVQKEIIRLAQRKKAVKEIPEQEVIEVEYEEVKPENKEIPDGKWKEEQATDAQIEVIRMMSRSSSIPQTWKERVEKKIAEGLTKGEASKIIDALKKELNKKKEDKE